MMGLTSHRMYATKSILEAHVAAVLGVVVHLELKMMLEAPCLMICLLAPKSITLRLRRLGYSPSRCPRSLIIVVSV